MKIALFLFLTTLFAILPKLSHAYDLSSLMNQKNFLLSSSSKISVSATTRSDCEKTIRQKAESLDEVRRVVIDISACSKVASASGPLYAASIRYF